MCGFRDIGVLLWLGRRGGGASAAHLRSGLPHSRCKRRETAENLRRSRAGGRWGGLALVVLVMVCWWWSWSWRGWVLGWQSRSICEGPGLSE
jgi:ferric-dicitrate binding protein FerR (iron transport regulator)